VKQGALALLLAALAATGCASRKPSIERDPGRYAPSAETEARKGTRLEERIHTAQDRISEWTREVEAGRGHAKDEAARARVAERLHACTDRLERVRQRANDVNHRAFDADDLEREVLAIQGDGEQAYHDGLVAIRGAEAEPKGP
jgi:hypothetical protein